MALPKTTQDRIFDILLNHSHANRTTATNEIFALFQEIYTTENERAQKLVDALIECKEALERCYDVVNFPADGETIQDEAIETATTALQQWNAGKEPEFEGSAITEPAPGISLGCISPEARELLDTIMEHWDKHRKNLIEVAGYKEEPTFYGFAYWLVRWSGLIQPAVTNPTK